ncbi:MAG: response regulator [Elusimicrobia bacterium]|nr:response regulator [Elusimicrobiota bacterium]
MKKILIVEDERHLSQIFKEELEDSGYDVNIMNTGSAAVDFMKNTKLDLVILDINLPDINGVKLLQHIKQEYPKLPVIMCTAYERFEEYYQRFVDGNSEFYSYLTKPVTLEKLISEVKRGVGDS